ncbi:MAG: hypothetical protein PHD83_03325, partial [Caldisericia bacterium]|nr:hypothetical protein [Caldisericia bacterium]
AVDLNTAFDVIRALQVTFPVGNQMYVGRKNYLVIRILEKGTKAPVFGVTVSISWPGQSKLLTTNEQGECSLEIEPEQAGKVRIYAFKETYIEEEVWLPITEQK